MIIKAIGIDPSLTNTGIAQVTVDLNTEAITVKDLKLMQTEKIQAKQVRVSSDSLRRAADIAAFLRRESTDYRIAFAEVPSGGQSAKAVYSFGISVGLLAFLGLDVPVIEVQPSETKLATVGTKTASKQEMIEWAVETYPSAPWIRRKLKGELVLTNANEHLADALAVVHAGIRTGDFQRLKAVSLAAA